MSDISRRFGPLDDEARKRGRPEDGYGALVRTIVGQQLSVRAAASIYGRVLAAFDGEAPTPKDILDADAETLRGCGLSGPKVAYLKDLARRTVEGEMLFGEIAGMPDEEVISRLTAVKGLGRWSADMFLMFHLGRPDVLPVGDLGIRRAVERAYGLPGLPDEATLVGLATPWEPHRTLASLYLWESLDNSPVIG